MVAAGRYFAAKQGLSLVEKAELVAHAVEAMHMDDLCPFDAEQKVLA